MFHSATPPIAPFPLLYTNKPITATDINWTLFLKMLPQPFFGPSLLSFNQPAHQMDYIHTQMCTHTHAPTHTSTHVHAYADLGVLFVSSSSVQPGFSCLHSPNLLSQGIQVRNHSSPIFFQPSFYTAASLPFPPSYLIITS